MSTEMYCWNKVEFLIIFEAKQLLINNNNNNNCLLSWVMTSFFTLQLSGKRNSLDLIFSPSYRQILSPAIKIPSTIPQTAFT